jgi:hypothetical protein
MAPLALMLPHVTYVLPATMAHPLVVQQDVRHVPQASLKLLLAMELLVYV